MAIEKTEQEKIEELSGNIVLGLERTLGELGPKLADQVDGLTTKQLRRALKATINYVATKTDQTDAAALKQEEQKFIGGMFALVESGVNYSLHILAELQKERESQGESNE